jgi:uncharacterized membrane protein YvbJ
VKEGKQMMFCKNCGHKIADGHEFCSECGQPVSSGQNKPEQSSQRAAKTPSNKKMSKKSKGIVASVIALVVLLGGTYYTVNKTIMSPKAVSEGFVKAVKEKDIEKVKSYVNEGQMELKANNEQTEAFITYLTENPKTFSDIADVLDSEATAFENADSKEEQAVLNSVESEEGYADLHKEGKKWGLFDHYTVRIHPFYANVTSEEDNTEIFIDNKKVSTVNSNDKAEDNVGPFLPGKHEIKAVVNGTYGKIDETEKINTANGREINVSFDWYDHYVDVYSDYEDATLYVNGKSTKEQVKDVEQIGPIPMDGSVKVYAKCQFSSGVKKTKVVEIRKNTDEVALMFDIDESSSISTDIEEESNKEQDSSAQDEKSIEETITSHYDSISSDDFSQAFSYFSAARKSKLEYDKWTDGFGGNIRDVVNEVSVTEVNGNEAIAYIEMTSYDANGDGTTLVQEWEGSWDLVKEGNTWGLGKAHLEKVSSRTE